MNNTDPFGLECERRGSDRLHCENYGPGDAWTIRRFLGGESGAGAFAFLTSLGLTQWSAKTCRGGFSEGQCGNLAESLATLTLHENNLCRLLGSRATQRFQLGRLRYHEGYIQNGDSRIVGLANVWQIWRAGTIVVSSHLFPGGPHSEAMTEILAHEEYHFLYLGSSIWYGVFGHHRGDPIYSAGETCGD